jgi:hypothetical protein
MRSSPVFLDDLTPDTILIASVTLEKSRMHPVQVLFEEVAGGRTAPMIRSAGLVVKSLADGQKYNIKHLNFIDGRMAIGFSHSGGFVSYADYPTKSYLTALIRSHREDVEHHTALLEGFLKVPMPD